MNAAKLSLFVLLLVAAIATPACGGKKKVIREAAEAETGAELLGTRKVNFRGDFDSIPVTLLEGTFKAIRIDVDGSAIEMWDIDVFFSNGGHQDVDTRLIFKEGSWSRRIDLRGGERGIKKVTFKYKSRNAATGKATVKLYGIH